MSISQRSSQITDLLHQQLLSLEHDNQIHARGSTHGSLGILVTTRLVLILRGWLWQRLRHTPAVLSAPIFEG
jgi:hypothetical protein